MSVWLSLFAGSMRVHEEHASMPAAAHATHAAPLEAAAARPASRAHATGHHMLGTLGMWVQAWNVSTDSGSVNPEVLDCLLEDDFTVGPG